ncbi:uncharacterized protein UDID_17294 [Ustilago sp. UG-2017a]|nr:uncharacterized protein UDID_17294 [Ustilago sp. UG-2017a]
MTLAIIIVTRTVCCKKRNGGYGVACLTERTFHMKLVVQSAKTMLCEQRRRWPRAGYCTFDSRPYRLPLMQPSPRLRDSQLPPTLAWALSLVVALELSCSAYQREVPVPECSGGEQV